MAIEGSSDRHSHHQQHEGEQRRPSNDPNSDDTSLQTSPETLAEEAPSCSSSSSSSLLPELVKTPPADQPLAADSLRRRRLSQLAAEIASRRRRSRALDEEVESPREPLLPSIAEFVVRAIIFQFNLLVFFSLIPFRLLQLTLSMVYDPCGTAKEVVHRVKACTGRICAWVSKTFWSRRDLGKLAARLAVGCFWSVYVGSILVGTLVTGFLGAGMVMNRVVEEPLQVVRDLSFDYTKPMPDAVVAVDSMDSVYCASLVSSGSGGFLKQSGSRSVAVNRRWELVISLTLPESDYNHRLGMFQVRTEFISESGKVTHRSSRPCMLRFKSPILRYLETFLKTSTLLTGHSSEAQVLNIKLSGLVERNDPTVCIRVILEPRAEHKLGAGIPEIYAASLKLESRLPFLKRMIWNWRRTIYIWVGMMLFFFDLLIILVCCRPALIPRTRPSTATASSA